MDETHTWVLDALGDQPRLLREPAQTHIVIQSWIERYKRITDSLDSPPLIEDIDAPFLAETRATIQDGYLKVVICHCNQR